MERDKMAVSQRKKDYNREYDKTKMTRIVIKTMNDKADAIKARAAELGKSTTRYILDLVSADLDAHSGK